MTDSSNAEGPPRPQRPARRQGGRPDARGARPPQARPQGGIPASEYGQHLEREHGLMVVEEPGWPTEVKRFRLVRIAREKTPEKVLATYEGTLPQAIAHFYGYTHPQGDHRQPEAPPAQSAPPTTPSSSDEAA